MSNNKFLSSAKRFTLLLLLTGLNILLALILFPIVLDKRLTYKQAFYISLPLIACLLFFVSKRIIWFYKEKDNFGFLDLIGFTILIFDVLLLIVNIYVWISLLNQ